MPTHVTLRATGPMMSLFSLSLSHTAMTSIRWSRISFQKVTPRTLSSGDRRRRQDSFCKSEFHRQTMLTVTVQTDLLTLCCLMCVGPELAAIEYPVAVHRYAAHGIGAHFQERTSSETRKGRRGACAAGMVMRGIAASL